MKEAVRKKALELGFDACGFTSAHPPDSAPHFQQWLDQGRHGEMDYLKRNAAKRVDPQQVLPGAQSILSLAAAYSSPDIQTPPPTRGRIARYARFADYHDVLGERLRDLTTFIHETAPPGTRSLAYVDTGPFLERDLAQRAGVGFAGKHTNLISRTLGNWFFLAEIITTARFDPDSPEKNRCGSCTRCISACPTQAITAPFHLDARRCISYLTIELKGPIPEELRPSIGSRIFGCDDCLEACPWNRFAREGRLMKPFARSDLRAPELLELLKLDQPAFKQRFAGTPLLRTKRRGLLRNVCVALGNLGDRTALPHLQRAASDPEPLIAEHARWAIQRLQSGPGSGSGAG